MDLSANINPAALRKIFYYINCAAFPTIVETKRDVAEINRK